MFTTLVKTASSSSSSSVSIRWACTEGKCRSDWGVDRGVMLTGARGVTNARTIGMEGSYRDGVGAIEGRFLDVSADAVFTSSRFHLQSMVIARFREMCSSHPWVRRTGLVQEPGDAAPSTEVLSNDNRYKPMEGSYRDGVGSKESQSGRRVTSPGWTYRGESHCLTRGPPFPKTQPSRGRW